MAFIIQKYWYLLWTIICIFGLLYITFMVTIFFLQSQIVYYPVRKITATPNIIGLLYEVDLYGNNPYNRNYTQYDRQPDCIPAHGNKNTKILMYIATVNISLTNLYISLTGCKTFCS